MSSEGNRVALIIACNRYSDPKLKELQAPSQDAARFARILEDPKIGEFKVSTLIDQPHWIITQKLDEFLNSCSKKDTLLLYFSCHGVKDEDGQLYFATLTTDRTLLYSTGVDSIFVNRLLERCRAEQKVVLLDCCFSGSFEKGSIAKSDTQVNVAEFLGKGRVIITASSAMQYAFEGTDKVENLGIGGSYFTNGLIKGLESGEADKDGDGKITYSELYRYVHDYVNSITPNQTPTLSTRGVVGDFVVFKNMRENPGSVKGTQTRTAAVENTTTITAKEEHDSFFKFIQEARKCLDQEQFDMAIKKFDAILALSEGHVEALNGKGLALCKVKKYAEALECFKEVLKIKSNHTEASIYAEMITEWISRERSGEPKATIKDTQQKTAALEKRTEEKVKKALTDSIQIPSEVVKEGDQLYKKRKYQEAILRYDQALKINPLSESVLNNRGNALRESGKHEEAIKCYDKAIEINPNYVEAWIDKGLALSHLGKTNEEMQCFDKAIEINPNYDRAWYCKGQLLSWGLRKYDEAIRCFDKIIERNPKHTSAWQMKGFVLEESKQYDKALECYDKAIEINPNNANTWWSAKGNLLRYRFHRLDEALECFDKAIEINPHDDLALEFKGDALSELSKYEEAIECYDKALEINLDNVNAWNRKGRALISLRRYHKAIECYDRAIEVCNRDLETNPGDSWRCSEAWNGKGNALYNLKNYFEAIKCYHKALEIYRWSDSDASKNKWDAIEKLTSEGFALLDHGRYLEAIKISDRLLEINPKLDSAWDLKGSCLERQGKYNEAIQCHDKAIEINPNDVSPWYNKGNSLSNLGKYEEAIQCYDKAIKRHPKYADAWYNKGNALFNWGKYEQAINCYDKVLEIESNAADAWYSKGNALYSLGKNEEADKCFKKAKELGYKG
jgi:tetratricopeptide (TPR) repeat protein